MAKKKTVKNGKKSLTQKDFASRIQDVRQIVIDRMNQKGLTAYGLAKKAQAEGGDLTEQTVRNFVIRHYNIQADKLSAVLAALELVIVPAEKVKPLQE